MTRKRIGLGKLSDFRTAQSEVETEPETPPVEVPAPVPVAVPKGQGKMEPVTPPEKLTTVNIKIRHDQRDWLDTTARRVRDNNVDPVPPSDRTYPQHLIQTAIDLLKTSDVNWQKVKNMDDLRKQLNL